MSTDECSTGSDQDRLLTTLERLLGIASPELRPALDRASSLVAEALVADKVDVFLYEADGDSLVALGTSDTPMGRRQHRLGLDRLPLANGGRAVAAYLAGEPFLQRRTDEDPEELRGTIDGLGVRSGVFAPLDVAGRRRGVLQVVSAEPERFSERDIRFVVAVAGWVGMVTHRAELSEELARDAERRARQAAGEELARLTRRQQEVAACIAEGLSNEEIAERLTLVPGTVANHVESILNRLGFRSRTQVAVWAVERGQYRSDLNDGER